MYEKWVHSFVSKLERRLRVTIHPVVSKNLENEILSVFGNYDKTIERMKIEYTEQQARLDTCRGEIEILNLQKEQVRRKFHSIIGNLHEPEKILEICDKTLREFFNG